MCGSDICLYHVILSQFGLHSLKGENNAYVDGVSTLMCWVRVRCILDLMSK